jgi:tetratricopeptide (TPR) repeat protein
LLRAEWRLEGSSDEQDKVGAADDARTVIALDPNVPEAYRILARAAFDAAGRKASDEQALKLNPYDSAALSDLAALIGADDPKGAIALLQKRQRVATTWSSDYQLLAQLQQQVGNYTEALQDIDNAIADAPWQLDFYTQRRDIEKKMGVGQAEIDLHFAQSMRAAAAYKALIGDDGPALKRYLLAFMTVSGMNATNGTFELQTIVRDLSTFLASNYGITDTRLFWRTLSQDPLLNASQRQLAAQEATRLSQ